jgi:hypothetical protein
MSASGKISELKNLLTSDFIIRTNSYFIIASNLGTEETERIIENTVERSVGCFYNNYFDIKPDEYTTIYLFKDDESYRYWAEYIYGDTDLSRFGYYKPDSKAMLMNISTGTGTLVHEITHALVRYDFQDIPSWFNEGLGSLYERCSLNNKEIIGYVNWRLPILHTAINKNKIPALSTLMKKTTNEFYGKGSDVHYAEARYLCMYLQEKNLLKTFYKKFRDTYESDRTGISQLNETLGKNINQFEPEFINWVLSLKYNE